MRPQRVYPTTTEVRKDPEYWNKRSMTFHREKIYYDQVIRTGECYFCKKYGRTQNYDRQTYLHHLDYDNDEPIMWTIELCSSCHYRCDKQNRRQVDRTYAWRERVFSRGSEDNKFVNSEMKRLGLKRY